MNESNESNGSKALVAAGKAGCWPGYARASRTTIGVDVTVVRVLVVVFCLITGGAGVLAYVAAWVIIPEEGENDSIAGNLFTKNRG